MSTSNKKYTVKKGDSLATIAQHFYRNDDEDSQRKIYEKNKDVIGLDSEKLTVGIELLIPIDNSAAMIPPNINEADIAHLVLAMLNQERSKKGLAPLTISVNETIILDNQNQRSFDEKSVLEKNQGTNVLDGHGQTSLNEEPLRERKGWRNFIDIKKQGSLVALGAGVVGFIAGLIGPTTNIITLRQEQPKLNLLEPVVQLSSPPTLTINSQVEKLLNRAYRKTSGKYNIDDKFERLIEQIDKIKDEEKDIQESPFTSYGQIGLNQPKDEKQKELIKPIIEYYKDKNNIKELLSYYKQENPNSSSSDLSDVKKTLETDFDRLANPLEDLEKALEKSSDLDGSKKLVAFVTVVNQSKLPNIIREKALLQVYDERGSIFDLDLDVVPVGQEEKSDNKTRNDTGDSNTNDKDKKLSANTNINIARPTYTLPSNDAVVLQISSSDFSTLGAKKDLVMSSFSKEYKYLLLIRNMHGNIWFKNGKLSSLGVDENLKSLRSKAEYLIQQKKEL